MMEPNFLRQLANLSEVREILRLLFAASIPLDIYEFHVRYGLSPAQVSRVVKVMVDFGVANEVDVGQILLTPQGKRWVIMNRRALFGRNYYWRDVPEYFRKIDGERVARRRVKLDHRDLHALGLKKRKEN